MPGNSGGFRGKRPPEEHTGGRHNGNYIFLKTRGRERGYVEKQQVEANIKGATVKVNVLDQETADMVDKL